MVELRARWNRLSQPLMTIIRKWALRKTCVNADQKGFCDIFGRTFGIFFGDFSATHNLGLRIIGRA